MIQLGCKIHLENVHLNARYAELDARVVVGPVDGELCRRVDGVDGADLLGHVVNEKVLRGLVVLVALALVDGLIEIRIGSQVQVTHRLAVGKRYLGAAGTFRSRLLRVGACRVLERGALVGVTHLHNTSGVGLFTLLLLLLLLCGVFADVTLLVAQGVAMRFVCRAAADRAVQAILVVFVIASRRLGLHIRLDMLSRVDVVLVVDDGVRILVRHLVALRRLHVELAVLGRVDRADEDAVDDGAEHAGRVRLVGQSALVQLKVVVVDKTRR